MSSTVAAPPPRRRSTACSSRSRNSARLGSPVSESVNACRLSCSSSSLRRPMSRRLITADAQGGVVEAVGADHVEVHPGAVGAAAAGPRYGRCCRAPRTAAVIHARSPASSSGWVTARGIAAAEALGGQAEQPLRGRARVPDRGRAASIAKTASRGGLEQQLGALLGPARRRVQAAPALRVDRVEGDHAGHDRDQRGQGERVGAGHRREQGQVAGHRHQTEGQDHHRPVQGGGRDQDQRHPGQVEHQPVVVDLGEQVQQRQLRHPPEHHPLPQGPPADQPRPGQKHRRYLAQGGGQHREHQPVPARAPVGDDPDPPEQRHTGGDRDPDADLPGPVLRGVVIDLDRLLHDPRHRPGRAGCK